MGVNSQQRIEWLTVESVMFLWQNSEACGRQRRFLTMRPSAFAFASAYENPPGKMKADSSGTVSNCCHVSIKWMNKVLLVSRVVGKRYGYHDKNNYNKKETQTLKWNVKSRFTHNGHFCFSNKLQLNKMTNEVCVHLMNVKSSIPATLSSVLGSTASWGKHLARYRMEQDVPPCSPTSR